MDRFAVKGQSGADVELLASEEFFGIPGKGDAVATDETSLKIFLKLMTADGFELKNGYHLKFGL